MTAARAFDDGRAPAADEIGSYVDHLLGHPGFRSSPRRRKMLAHVVDQTLAGRAGRLKAYGLAVAVLDRDERFDTQTDPTVRIEVGRLRRDLEHHHLTAGANARREIPPHADGAKRV